MSDLSADPGWLEALPLRAGGARRCALLLHGLPPDDRQWLLSQLDAGERELVSALLSELQALGLPSDPAWRQEALEASSVAPSQPSPAPAPPASPASADGALVDAVARLPADQVARVLYAEPEGLVLALLGCRPWPWRSAVQRELHLRPGGGSADDGADPGPGWPAEDAPALHRADRLALQLLLERARASDAPDAPGGPVGDRMRDRNGPAEPPGRSGRPGRGWWPWGGRRLRGAA